jgi:hypothetical protein
VNDRSEHYSRKQIFYLDPKWMVQLRYFLGMKFDKLFMDPEKWVGYNKPGESVGHNKPDEPVGHIKPGEVGILRCQDLEYGAPNISLYKNFENFSKLRLFKFIQKISIRNNTLALDKSGTAISWSLMSKIK